MFVGERTNREVDRLQSVVSLHLEFCPKELSPTGPFDGRANGLGNCFGVLEEQALPDGLPEDCLAVETTELQRRLVDLDHRAVGVGQPGKLVRVVEYGLEPTLTLLAVGDVSTDTDDSEWVARVVCHPCAGELVGDHLAVFCLEPCLHRDGLVGLDDTGDGGEYLLSVLLKHKLRRVHRLDSLVVVAGHCRKPVVPAQEVDVLVERVEHVRQCLEDGLCQGPLLAESLVLLPALGYVPGIDDDTPDGRVVEMVRATGFEPPPVAVGSPQAVLGGVCLTGCRTYRLEHLPNPVSVCRVDVLEGGAADHLSRVVSQPSLDGPADEPVSTVTVEHTQLVGGVLEQGVEQFIALTVAVPGLSNDVIHPGHEHWRPAVDPDNVDCAGVECPPEGVGHTVEQNRRVRGRRCYPIEAVTAVSRRRVTEQHTVVLAPL